jgi:hypothetical protein
MSYLRPVDLRRLGAVIALCSFSLPVLGFTQEATAKEVCVRAASGEVVCGMLVAKPVDRPLPKPVAGQGSTVEKDGLRFQSAGCSRNRQESGIICGVLITNLGDAESKAFVYSNNSPSVGKASRAIEANGTTSYSDLVYIGSDSNSQYIIVTLDPNVPTKVNFKFKEVVKETISLSGLALGYAINKNGYEGRVETAVVRNVTIK